MKIKYLRGTIAMMSLLSILGLSGFSPLSGFKKTVFKNGLNGFIKEDHKIPLVSVQLWVRAGSIDENTRNNGVSHCLEHMLFKGTVNFPVGEISRIVESYGGYINAATSKEFTYFYIDISTDGFYNALRIMADLANQRANFSKDELELERTVILEEIKRSKDQPEHILFENFNSLLYSITPYKWEVIGTTETVSSLSREDIMDYYKKFYVPNNMIVVVAGDIKYKNAKTLINNLFDKSRPALVPERKNLIEPVKPPVTQKVKKDVQHTYMMTGFIGPELAEEKSQYVGDILSIILGSGRSSRLNRSLREEKQLVYSVNSGFYTQLGSGMFVVSVMCDQKNTDKVRQEISNEFDRIINQEISKEEFEKAKELVKSHWYYEFETCNQQAQTIGYWMVINKLDFVATYLANVEKVSYMDVKKFMNLYYTGLTTSIVEPAKVMPEKTETK
ncbi:MAG: insulinase family protein [Elusimicrobia bacterium]|nr:insulinase family protein [Elusimicrobiota bacterium]